MNELFHEISKVASAENSEPRHILRLILNAGFGQIVALYEATWPKISQMAIRPARE